MGVVSTLMGDSNSKISKFHQKGGARLVPHFHPGKPCGLVSRYGSYFAVFIKFLWNWWNNYLPQLGVGLRTETVNVQIVAKRIKTSSAPTSALFLAVIITTALNNLSGIVGR